MGVFSNYVITANIKNEAITQPKLSNGVGAFTRLGETILDENSSSISVSSIPSGYRYLEIYADLILIGSSTNQKLLMRLNNISDSVYGWQNTYSASTTVSADRGINSASVSLMNTNWVGSGATGHFACSLTIPQNSKEIDTGIHFISWAGITGNSQWVNPDVSGQNVTAHYGVIKSSSSLTIDRVDIFSSADENVIKSGSRLTVYGWI